MGLMQNVRSGEKRMIMSSHVFGRDQERVTTQVNGAEVSRVHASMTWKNDHWFFTDFSKNGTLINGHKVYHSGLRLGKGDILQFGEHEASHWQITDDKAPCSFLVSQSTQQAIELDPARQGQPLLGARFYYNELEGWQAYVRGKSTPLLPGEVYEFVNDRWAFVENELLADTKDDLGDLSQAYFQFQLSPDEEHINLKLSVRGQEMDLGEKAHNYLCLALARKRIQDIHAGYEEADQGWLNTADLLTDLAREQQKELDVYYINLQVHRFRRLLKKTKPFGFHFVKVLERRKNEIRFGHRSLVVVKEGNVVSDTRLAR